MAKRFDGGVGWYTHMTAEIFFPEDAVVCIACPCLGAEYGIRRHYCRLTGEYIPDPENMRVAGCPLKEDKEEETK
jgi:hypothetical protein